MVKLIVYNIEYCEGITGFWWEYLQFWKLLIPPRGIDKKIVKEIKKLNPEIVALVECDTNAPYNKDKAKYFEKKLGMNSYKEKIQYPKTWWAKTPLLNHRSNALIAKHKLKNVKYHFLKEGMKRLVIEASVNLPKKVTLLLAHLEVIKAIRDKQIKELIEIVNKIKNPVILMGDFNTFNGEKEIKELLKQTHLEHKYKMGKRSLTWPTCHPSKRLDYVLTSKKIKVNKYEVLNYKFSDHLPIFVEFKVK